ncbi:MULTISPECIES: DUF3107 domain-containing protein [Agromyces]|uniref:DUF3107 domain-containing protein n=1 Tax=Agromyces indicus TaxID=758919 RepID=A0ABU1FJ78_9MICO|nr:MULTISPECIES: DUF3107 domain-containing protein [Agromyces]KZE92771.1 hypothetical protein AVP42_02206 [Agromyces sp. NDB4Y10]MCK8608948.1 DUF3107 domain-containing protein [Agromyces sp. C10]MDR5691810.1 DUF3107 domain-containing protein [Agromyces indicus]
MDLRIGIQNSPRELGFETSQTAEEVEQAVAAALTGQSPVLRLTDSKGAVFVVPAAALAYVEIGTESARRIGFVG